MGPSTLQTRIARAGQQPLAVPGLGDMPDDEDGSGYGTTAAKVIGGRGAAKWSKLAGGADGPAIAVLAGSWPRGGQGW
jgi:hypothetical protein